MINNRQAGRRNRGRNNGRPNGPNRGGSDNGNRIDNRARGNAAQLLEKYRNMARDAQLAGDRVNAEYYLQFADHYFRVLADNRARQEEQQPNQPYRPRREDAFGDDGDDFEGGNDAVDYGDEGERAAPPRRENYRDERRDRPQQQPRADDRQGGGDREDRPERQDRQERQGGYRERSDEQGGEGRGRNRYRRDQQQPQLQPQPQQAVETVSEPAVPQAPAVEQDAPASLEAQPVQAAPKRRGRPPKVKVESAGAEVGLDLAALPPAISRADNDGEEAASAPRKRTRRTRPAAEAAE